MIRSMHLTVTVGAASVKEENRSRRPRRHRVTGCVMARGAEPRIGHFEKPIIDGSVGLVAIATVFKCRRMLPQKGPTPFGVAGVTVFIDAGLLELGRIGGAMWIVAVRTSQLAFSQRHMRRAHELGFSLQMTLTANLGFGPLIEKRRLLARLHELMPVGGLFHQRMTGNASQPAVRVGTRFPVSLNAALMTTETSVVLDSW